MDYKTSERCMLISCAVGIIIVAIGNRRQSLMMSAVGAAVMVLGLLQTLVFYKCPHCGKRFQIGSKSPKICPHCGADLEEAAKTSDAETTEASGNNADAGQAEAADEEPPAKTKE